MTKTSTVNSTIFFSIFPGTSPHVRLIKQGEGGHRLLWSDMQLTGSIIAKLAQNHLFHVIDILSHLGQKIC